VGGSREGLQPRSEMAKWPADEQGMQTHRRARLARSRGRAAREWVVRALRNGAEVRGRMVKGEGGGAGCCAGSERATTRRAC